MISGVARASFAPTPLIYVGRVNKKNAFSPPAPTRMKTPRMLSNPRVAGELSSESLQSAPPLWRIHLLSRSSILPPVMDEIRVWTTSINWWQKFSKNCKHYFRESRVWPGWLCLTMGNPFAIQRRTRSSRINRRLWWVRSLGQLHTPTSRSPRWKPSVSCQ